MLRTSPKIAIAAAVIVASSLLLSAGPLQAEEPSNITAGQPTPTVQAPPGNHPTLPETDLSEQRSRVIKGVFYSLAMGLLVFSLWKQFKRRGQGVSQQQIEILSRRYVSTNCALVIAQIQGQRFLLSQGADSIQLIAELTEKQAAESKLHATKTALELPRAIHGERA